MYKLISYFTAAATALTIGLMSAGTVQAQPVAAAHGAVLLDMTTAKQALSQNVQYYPERRYDRPRYDPRYEQRHRPRHWNGPRPYQGWGHSRPQYRPHYRPYYQPQFRPAPPRPYRERSYRSGGSSHVNWCYNRYRSYRASDNTFQPNYGPRRLCYSPFI
ncbi:BA14K family protein [Pseudochrobactrum sp. MP213Fo]|uniref:BA14K family protein n=1 Tax=Pseudochrobactrum sp. MP213Fo TaxID=3022250 RepID=UPI003BA2DF30